MGVSFITKASMTVDKDDGWVCFSIYASMVRGTLRTCGNYRNSKLKARGTQI